MVIFVPFFIAIVAAVLPALIWLFLFTREDRHPEPTELIAYTFTLGGLMVIPTLLVQIVFKNWGPESALLSLIALAFLEEIFKFLGSYVSVRRNKAFDEPVDAMIYTITAALGFATIENFLNLVKSQDILLSLTAADAVSTAALRFIGATFLHALASALVGYFWARGIVAKRHRGYLAIGIVAATAVHAIFNYLIATFQGESNLLYPSIFLILVAFFVMIDFEKLRGAKPFSGKQ